MKVLVCSSHSYRNAAVVYETLDRLHARTPISEIVHGGCGEWRRQIGETYPIAGADVFAMEWARRANVKQTQIDPQVHPSPTDVLDIFKDHYNKLIDIGKPDLLLAFEGAWYSYSLVYEAFRRKISIAVINDDGTQKPKLSPDPLDVLAVDQMTAAVELWIEAGATSGNTMENVVCMAMLRVLTSKLNKLGSHFGG